MTHAYRQCLASPHVKYLFATNLLGRLPNGMIPLEIALFLRAGHTGFGAVGAVAAVYGLSAAVGGPLIGRMVDRFGQVAVLATAAGGSAAGLLLLVAVGGRSPDAAGPAAALAGLCSPPLEPSIRALWPTLLATPEAVDAAYALDTSLQELVYVCGPLLVVAIASSLSPTAAAPITAAALIAGTAGYVVSRPVRAWRPTPRQAADWAGPLRSRQIRRVLASMGGVGIGLGALNIAAVAYEERSHHAGLSGIVLGANALGALIGGLTYGARSWRSTAARRLTVFLAAAAACYLPLFLLMPTVPTVGLVFAAGLFLTPILTCGFAVVGQAAPRGAATESFAWLVAAVGVGNAAGASLAGAAEQHAGLWAVFLIPGAACLLSAGFAASLAALGGWGRQTEARSAPEP
jgi:predicted MFS family arabinose efflux permease